MPDQYEFLSTLRNLALFDGGQKVIDALLVRGRLTLPQLVRYTSLRPRLIRAALLVLIQHNLIYHDLVESEGEIFEVNIDECLSRLRFGRYIWQTQQLFGEAAAEIVQCILDHGKLQLPEILVQLARGDTKRTLISSLIHPPPSEKYSTVGVKLLTQSMTQLVSRTYLRPSTILSHVAPQDKLMKYEAEEIEKISGLPTTKQLREAKDIARARLSHEESEQAKIGIKPSTNHLKSKSKAREEIDHGVYFRLNYDRYHMHLRSDLVEMAARERFNDSAALVLRATLESTQSDSMKLSDIRSDPTSISNICMHIPEDTNLSSGLMTKSSKSLPQAVIAKEYIGILSSADDPTPEGRNASFVTLASSKVYVEFGIVCRRLRQWVLEAATREWHGQQGVRLLRLLLSTGKLEEKQISKMALMAMKDVRTLLAALSNDLLVSIQEVPKTADRAPSRTFYLWYVDLDKAYSSVLGKLYKTLYNISQRRQAELAAPELKQILEKTQRSDISEDDSLLTRTEREAIQRWEAKQNKLAILEARVDETVFILRDLNVFGVDD